MRAKRTAAGALHNAVGVVPLQQIQPWGRRIGQMNFLGLLVTALYGARQVIPQETPPGVLRFPLEEHVTIQRTHVRQEIGQGAADDDRLAQAPEALRDFKNALNLDDVAGNADDGGIRLVIDAFADVLVAECYGEVGRRQRGKCEEPQGWENRLIGSERQEMLQTPVGDGKPGLDEVDLASGGPRYWVHGTSLDMIELPTLPNGCGG